MAVFFPGAPLQTRCRQCVITCLLSIMLISNTQQIFCSNVANRRSVLQSETEASDADVKERIYQVLTSSRYRSWYGVYLSRNTRLAGLCISTLRFCVRQVHMYFIRIMSCQKPYCNTMHSCRCRSRGSIEYPVAMLSWQKCCTRKSKTCKSKAFYIESKGTDMNAASVNRLLYM